METVLFKKVSEKFDSVIATSVFGDSILRRWWINYIGLRKDKRLLSGAVARGVSSCTKISFMNYYQFFKTFYTFDVLELYFRELKQKTSLIYIEQSAHLKFG